MKPQEMKDWRKRMGGITQQRAADMLGVTISTIARYETMQRNIPEVVKRLCDCLEDKARE